MAFDAIAAAYDILSNTQKRLEREGSFLRTLAGPGTRVLDLACGTGVHARFLADLGAEVAACDLSPAMIARAARARPHPRIRYAVGDMRTPPSGPFDLVLCLGNSINLLPDAEAVQAMFRAVRQTLSENGRFLLHAINPAGQAHAEPSLVRRSGEAEGQEIVVSKAMIPQQERRFLILACFWRQASANATWQSSAETATLLDLPAETLQRLLADAGFRTISVYGSMDGSPLLSEGSPDAVLVSGSSE